MSAGMQFVDVAELRHRFRNPVLVEVDGDRRDLDGPGCEVVDVQSDIHNHGQLYTILHCPGGSLPVPAQRAMGIVYE